MLKNIIEAQWSIKRFYNTMIKKISDKHDLKLSETKIIMFLYNNPNYKTANDIVMYKDYSKSYVSASINNLRKKGFLEIEINKSNRRENIITISERSVEILEDINLEQSKYMNKIKERMGEQKTEFLAELLDEFVKATEGVI